MEDSYIGQWFRCKTGLGKIVLNAGTYYKCVIFGEEVVLITWRSLKETKLLEFLNCPDYYNLMVGEIEPWEAYIRGEGPVRWEDV